MGNYRFLPLLFRYNPDHKFWSGPVQHSDELDNVRAPMGYILQLQRNCATVCAQATLFETEIRSNRWRTRSRRNLLQAAVVLFTNLKIQVIWKMSIARTNSLGSTFSRQSGPSPHRAGFTIIRACDLVSGIANHSEDRLLRNLEVASLFHCHPRFYPVVTILSGIACAARGFGPFCRDVYARLPTTATTTTRDEREREFFLDYSYTHAPFHLEQNVNRFPS